jgi:hypothetical protein
MNDNVQQGQTIINSLLAEGVQQWASSPLAYEDDWKDVESLQSRANFADDCLAHLKDEDSKNVIVSVLLAEAVDTFDALVSTWPEEERAKVPVVNEGIRAGRAWLEQHSAIKPKHKGVSVNDSNCKAETIEEFCVEVGIDLHAPEAQGRSGTPTSRTSCFRGTRRRPSRSSRRSSPFFAPTRSGRASRFTTCFATSPSSKPHTQGGQGNGLRLLERKHRPAHEHRLRGRGVRH